MCITRRTVVALGALPMLLSCTTWIAPAPEMVGRGLFAQPVDPAASQAWAAQRAASSADKSALCKDGVAARHDPRCYEGGVGEAHEQSERALATYRDHLREIINTNAAYAQLVFPFGGAVAYEKLRGATNHNLLLPAVVGLVIYNMLKATIPERDKHFALAAGQLMCSMAWNDQWLFLSTDINQAAPKGADASESIGLPSLAQTMTDLKTHLNDFNKERAKLNLQGRGAGSAPAGALERLKSSGVSKGHDTTRLAYQRMAQQATLADETLRRLAALRRQIPQAATNLNFELAAIQSDLYARLQASQPAPSAPTDALRPMVDALTRLATAHSTADAGYSLMAPEVPPEWLAGLNEDSVDHLGKVVSNEGVALHDAWSKAQQWLSLMEQRRDAVQRSVASLPCHTTTLAHISPTAPGQLPVSPIPALPASQATGVTTRPLPN